MTRPGSGRLAGGLVVAIVVLAGCARSASPSLLPSAVDLHTSAPAATPVPSAPTPAASRSAPPASPSPSAVACATADLRIRGGRMGGGTGTAHGDVYFTNVGASPCSLTGAPRAIELLRADGSALKILMLAPDATPGPPVTLRPDVQDAVSLAFNWQNWCGPAPGSLRVRITLPTDGSVVGPFDGPPEYDYVPRCDQPTAPSGMTLLWSFTSATPSG